MASVTVTHSTPANGTFSGAGAAAWDAGHIAETAEMAQQVAQALEEEFTGTPTAEPPPIEAMTMAEIDAEIGVLLRKKLRDEEDEAAMMLIMLASDL